MVCGILSGVISSSIANPTDVLKVGSPVSWASLIAQLVKNPPAMQETWVQFLGWEDRLEKGMETHSGILAWRTPRTEEPGGLQPIALQESDMAS